MILPERIEPGRKHSWAVGESRLRAGLKVRLRDLVDGSERWWGLILAARDGVEEVLPERRCAKLLLRKLYEIDQMGGGEVPE